MARTSNKAAVLEDEVVETETNEPTPKQIVNEGIARVIEATGIDVQKNRYKAMRAIAWQAFVEAIDAEDFDGLVDRAIANVDTLPAGWEIERPVKDEEPKPTKTKTTKTAAKPAAKKATAKAAPAKSARKRPAR